MSLRSKRETLQQILTERDYADWTVLEPGAASPDDGENSWLLFNFKTRREAKVVVPSDWFYDLRRDNVIRELITLAINNRSHTVTANRQKVAEGA